MSDFIVQWIDRGREPQCAPNPRYPHGVDIDAGVRPACKVELPYPAKRCGLYYTECRECRSSMLITTAGRPDDPRSVMMPCRT